eukprot:scaffold3540_cov163-Pinguiococcus_pyrenoidosus.AAC.1
MRQVARHASTTAQQHNSTTAQQHNSTTAQQHHGFYVIPNLQIAHDVLADMRPKDLTSIGYRSAERLEQLGGHTCRDVRRLGISVLKKQFGEIARDILLDIVNGAKPRTSSEGRGAQHVRRGGRGRLPRAAGGPAAAADREQGFHDERALQGRGQALPRRGAAGHGRHLPVAELRHRLQGRLGLRGARQPPRRLPPPRRGPRRQDSPGGAGPGRRAQS